MKKIKSVILKDFAEIKKFLKTISENDEFVVIKKNKYFVFERVQIVKNLDTEYVSEILS